MTDSPWRGLKALVHDAVDATTDLVGMGHASAHRRVESVATVSGVGPIVRPVQRWVGLGTRSTLGSIKAVNHLVAVLSDTALDLASPVRPDTAPVPLRSDVVNSAAWIGDAALGALNGSVGDHLAATGNPLDLGLRLRWGDAYVSGELGQEAALVLVHGLGTTEWCWSLDAEEAFGDPAASLGTLLGEDLGMAPIFVRYNTGRKIRENGRALAEALESQLGTAERLILLGHSMGGLVARSACHHAQEAGHRWLSRVEWVISIGTPHQGAPLARFGAALDAGLAEVDLPATQVIAGVLRGRSAGVKDLEHGEVWGSAPVPLIEGPQYAFLGTTLTEDPAHPAGRWIGDLLVQTQSSAGPVDLAGSSIHDALLGGIPHHRIQAHPRVLEALRRVLLTSGDR